MHEYLTITKSIHWIPVYIQEKQEKVEAVPISLPDSVNTGFLLCRTHLFCLKVNMITNAELHAFGKIGKQL